MVAQDEWVFSDTLGKRSPDHRLVTTSYGPPSLRVRAYPTPSCPSCPCSGTPDVRSPAGFVDEALQEPGLEGVRQRPLQRQQVRLPPEPAGSGQSALDGLTSTGVEPHRRQPEDSQERARRREPRRLEVAVEGGPGATQRRGEALDAPTRRADTHNLRHHGSGSGATLAFHRREVGGS